MISIDNALKRGHKMGKQSDPTHEMTDTLEEPLPGPSRAGPSHEEAREDPSYEDVHEGPSHEETREGPAQEIESQSEDLIVMIGELNIGGDDIKKKRYKFPLRPVLKERSMYGCTVLLKTNHFSLEIGKNAFTYHYNVKIEEEIKEKETPEQMAAEIGMTPEKKGKANVIHRKASATFNRSLFNQMFEKFKDHGKPFYNIIPFYDGKSNMYTSRVIKNTENRRILALSIDYEEYDRIRKFWIKMQLTKTNNCINLGALNSENRKNVSNDLIDDIAAVNIISRYKSALTIISIGQSLYDPNESRIQLKSFEHNGQLIGGLTELGIGNYQSVKYLKCGITINVDRSMAVFVKNQTVEAMIKLLLNAKITEIPKKFENMNVKKIENEIMGLQIEAIHIKYDAGHYRKYRVLGLSKNSVKDEFFDWIGTDKNGQKIKRRTSVAEYFKEKYNIKNINTNLQCIVVGNERNKIMLPIEVCRIVENQWLRRELTDIERSEITPHTLQSPFQRFNSIENYVKSLNALNSQYISEFDIKINEKPINVNGRILNSPILSNGNQITPKNGFWDMRNKKFHKCATIEKWILIDMSHVNIPKVPGQRYCDDLKDRDHLKFVNDIKLIATEHSMTFKMPSQPVRIDNPKKENIRPVFEKYKHLKFLWFIMPDKRYYKYHNLHVDTLYDEIKLMGDSVYGIATQCISVTKFEPSRNDRSLAEVNKSVINNCLLKVNAKLGGTNVIINTPILKLTNVMIIGADVNHPAPADKVSPSIAATVGSYDMNFCKYTPSISVQKKFRDEIIINIDKMVIHHLKEYRNLNGKLPDEIIFYRDGVSDGQFGHVLENEVPLIKEGFKQFPKYKPKLTFIVVQKRHHTRFMPENIRGNERFQNVAPGTVVDEKIVHPTDFDFYLCSHEGLLGTSRAPHYYVLADDIKFTSDDLQKLTYYLCYIYVRCNKSVSIPTPVYYAHLLAFRAKGYLSALKTEETPVPRQRDDEEAYERYLKGVIPKMTINDALKKEIFFC